MIFDRTQNDVNEAIRLRREKVQTFQELTDDEIEILERGTITIVTLNRIEQKQEELRGLFNEIGYWNTSIITKEWDFNGIFDASEFQRIINNVNVLRDAFFSFSYTPSTPSPEYHFENINSVEKILYDLECMVDDMSARYKYCGTFECGGE